MAEEGRDKYLASRAPRVRRTHPARSAQALRTSGAGIVHREMMDLQRQPNLGGADVDRLKELRRDWNRNRKYTDAGMSLAGVVTPQGAQDAFMRSTEDFRQLNKPAYNQMYPLTGGFMDYADKGGIWGAMLSELAGKTKKRIKDFGDSAYSGITSALAGDTPEEKAEYVAKTFGPHLEDVPYGGPPPYEYEGPWPHPEGEPSLVPEELTREEKIQALVDEEQKKIDNFETTISSDILDDAIESQWGAQEKQDDYYSKSNQGEMVFADVPDEWAEPLSFDEGREDYIRRQNEYVSPVSAPLGIPNPQGDFDKFQEYPYPEIGIEFGGEPIPPIIPYNDSAREAGIMRAMRAPYTRENYSLPFPPRGPHDPFNPDQQIFENEEEYRAWLRRKRLGY